ncbi:hypothetical protein ACH5RR_000426 [Cinchona calisaya]|uniref:Uncharacterized protein n=1 Tax=Cinchona calisaya TaxID=153742 RepID=A0ABD3B0M6_9GENT
MAPSPSPALFKKPHVPASKSSSSSSCSNVFCKSLIIILVLVVIPLFPSQAPDFISQTNFSKFWELLHLLVIGLAVSYGLFCRKCGKIVSENLPGNDRNDSTSAFSHDAYLSGVLNVTSFFEDGFENLCISDGEKKILEKWDCLKIEKYSVVDGKKIRSLKLASGIEEEDVCEADKENNFSQIWNSQCFQGENLVVVADGNCPVDEYKPLGLPIRSLRSRLSDTEKSEFSSRTGGKVEKFRGPIPINLEKKFEEVAGPSTIPWQSRSRRMEMRGGVSNTEPSCHFRPHSGGDFEFERLKSRSFRQPISSPTSCVSKEASKNENYLDSKNDIKGISDTVSQSTIVTDGGSFGTKARGFSIGSSRELDIERTSKEYFNDSKLRAMQDVLDRGKKSGESIISDAKPSILGKVLRRGRSVRTIRSSGVFASDEMKSKENYPKQMDDNVGAISDQFEAPALVKRVKGGENKDSPVNLQKQNSTKVHPLTKEIFSEDQNDEMHNFADSTLVNNSELESESDNFQESSDEKEAEPHHIEDAEIEGSEVDRKADEFIAKFREQMRLQKIASVKRYSCRA